MPGLKQTVILAHKYLKQYLLPHRYEPIYSTIQLWHHKTKPTKFCLFIDNFGIKYQSKEDTEYLCNAIGVNYYYTVDFEGKNYCSLRLYWNYKLGYADIDIPKVIPSILKKLNYVLKVSLQYSLYCHTPIQYSRRGTQQMMNNAQLLLLPKDEIKTIQ